MRIPNSVDTQKALFEKTEFAKRKWFYAYAQLPAVLDEQRCERAIQKLFSRYSKETKAWDDIKNTEWTCRLYMAAKLIMMATLQLNSLDFAESVNLRAATPHLRYYTLLSLSRAICLTLPENKWNDGDLLTMNHDRALKSTANHVSMFDQKVGVRVDSAIRLAKAHRELIDYRAPSSGYSDLSRIKRFKSLCRLLAELAQMNSELLETSFENQTSDVAFEILESEAWKLLDVEIGGHSFIDREDIRRISYLARKHPRPANLRALMTDGHVEQFFGAWCDDSERPGCFDPDDHWDVIFDI